MLYFEYYFTKLVKIVKKGRKMTNSPVYFYSTTGDNSICKAVCDALAPAGLCVQKMTSFGDMVFSSKVLPCYLIVDATYNFGDVPKLTLNKLFRAGMIEKVIYIVAPNCKISFCTKIFWDSQFIENLTCEFKRIEEDRLSKIAIKNHSWKKIIGKKLYSWGISYRHSGFSLILEALLFYLDRRGSPRLYKNLYPHLSKIFSLSFSAVEGGIRKSIMYASRTENFPFDYVPSVKEFLRYACQAFSDLCVPKHLIRARA